MTTEIVVATRNGLAEGPDGAKYRLARGRTLGDARHPLVQAHPELFSPYAIDLPYEGNDHDGPSAGGRDDRGSWPEKVAEVEAIAEGYRVQLAAIVEGLHTRGLVPADLDTTTEGWLAKLVSDILDRSRVEDPSSVDQSAADATAPEPPAADRPRKRAPRRAAPRPAAAGDAEE